MYFWIFSRIPTLIISIYYIVFSSYLIFYSATFVTMRQSLSDNIFFWSSYFWTTNETLLPLLVMVTLIFRIQSKKLKGSLFNFANTLLVIFFIHCESFPTIFNELTIFGTETSQIENPFLLNKLNKIHPPIFYIVFGCLIGGANSSLISRFRVQTLITQLILVVVLLMLGSWWAFQEGTWGGWWNWDASEVLAYFMLILTLEHFHWLLYYRSMQIKPFHTLASKLNNAVLLIFFSTLQLSFTSSSHSFGIKFTHLFSIDLLFINIILIASSGCIAYSIFSLMYERALKSAPTHKFFNTRWGNFTIFKFQIMLFLFFFIILLSLFSILPEIFASSTVGRVDLSLFSNITSLILFLLLIPFTTLFTQQKLVVCFLMLFVITTNPFWVISGTVLVSSRVFNIVHLPLLSFLLFSLSAQASPPFLYETENFILYTTLSDNIAITNYKVISACLADTQGVDLSLYLLNIDGFVVFLLVSVIPILLILVS